VLTVTYAHAQVGAHEDAVRCWVGVPSDELRFLVGQRLAGFGFATCLFVSLVADPLLSPSAEMTPRHESERSQRAYSHRLQHGVW